MKKVILALGVLFSAAALLIGQGQFSGGGGGGVSAGVSTFSGDGNLISNSGSSGSVTTSLANAAANSVWGNATGSPAAPGYTANPSVATLTASGQITGAGFKDTSIKYLTSAMGSQTSATCTDITGFTWAIAANKNYRLSCVIPMTFTASATIAMCLGGPGTPTSYTLVEDLPLTTSVVNQFETFGAVAWGTKTAASTAPGAVNKLLHVDASIQNGATASGTNLSVQTAANGTNGITVLADSSCTLTQVN